MMTVSEIHRISIEFRGEVINVMTSLEKCMDEILCQHFTDNKEKANDMMLAVFGGLRITFENKRGILDYLYRNKKRKFAKGNDLTLISNMQKLFSTRTILAHYVVDMSESAQKLDDGDIRFISLNNKSEYKIFTKKDRKDFHDLLLKVCIELMRELVGALPPSEILDLQTQISSWGNKLS